MKTKVSVKVTKQINSAETGSEESRSKNKSQNQLGRYCQRICLWVGKVYNHSSEETKLGGSDPPKDYAKILVVESWHEVTMLLLTHLVPMISCCVLVSLNLRGYFVGKKIALGLDKTTEATAMLGLQLAVKLLVRFVSVIHHFQH